MSDEPQHGTAPIAIGDDLYGVSITELEMRIAALHAEIARTEAELTKKRTERSAADKLFGG